MTGLGPQTPANWYLLGKASALRVGDLASHSIGGRGIVVWRGRESGRIAAFDAQCAHMGCHLARGDVIGDKLRCGLHHRLIAADGSFGQPTDEGLRQPTLSVREYCGGLWAFCGAAAQRYDLDEFGLADFPSCYAGQYEFPLSWQALVANGFDAEHLASVHERRLLDAPTLDLVGEGGIELAYRTKPTGRGLADRITGWLGPDGVHGRIAARNGSIMLVRSRLGSRRSFILMSFAPTRAGGTMVRAIVGMEGAKSIARTIQARLAAHLFKAFLFKDLQVLEDLEWHEPQFEHSLGDRFTRRLCAYFRELHGA